MSDFYQLRRLMHKRCAFSALLIDDPSVDPALKRIYVLPEDDKLDRALKVSEATGKMVEQLI